jgi:transcriptional antiterminator RfaH
MDRPLHWLLAYTKPRQERVAEEHLRRQGYEVLCPQIRIQKLRNRRWTWVEEPLFPRYLFVGAGEGLSWAPVRSTVGVTSLVRFGGQVAAVPETLVETLRTSAAEPQRHRPIYQQGQKVRIVAGPFATLEGVFDMAEGAERATVLLSLLSRPIPVSVDVSQLRAEQ